jgi:hypothetical protein
MVERCLTTLGKQSENIKKYFCLIPMEGLAMQMRSLLIASLAATVASAALAEPAKPAAPAAAQPAPARPAQVLLASAEQPQAAASASGQPAPAKRPRAARVTSCRCGEQVAEPTDDSDTDQD